MAFIDKLTENSAIIASLNEAFRVLLPTSDSLKIFINPINVRNGENETKLEHYYTLCQISNSITHGIFIKKILYSGPGLDFLINLIKLNIKGLYGIALPDESNEALDKGFHERNQANV
jgi:hypothetical protein